jgi:hypothetical protein
VRQPAPPEQKKIFLTTFMFLRKFGYFKGTGGEGIGEEV